MKRDMDLVRELMLRLEAQTIPAGAIRYLDAYDDSIAVPGYSPEEIEQHLSLIARSGFIVTSHNAARSIGFSGLEWAGHDFLDSVRDPEIWQATKQGAEKAKGFTVELLVAFAKGIIKKKIADLSGVEIDL